MPSLPLLLAAAALAAPSLEDLATTGAKLGGPSGHCPAVGAPDTTGMGEYGTTWTPLGFSKQGAFASLSFEDSDMIPRWIVEVRSLATDKPLGSVSWSVEPSGEPPRLPDVRAFLAREGAAIDALLTEHGIELAALPVQPSPFTRGGRTYTVAQPEIPPVPDDYLYGSWFDTTLTAEGLGTKRVDTSRNVLRHAVLGVIQSPLEPRAAIVTAVTGVGFEGVRECRIRVIGAHLESGFPTPAR